MTMTDKKGEGVPSEPFDIQEYMSRGIERLMKDALRATVKNPRESAFMLRFSAASRSASKKRKEYEKNGEHVPPFLIASITSSCNLHCAGCYSRCSSATVDSEPVSQLSAGEWSRATPFGLYNTLKLRYESQIPALRYMCRHLSLY